MSETIRASGPVGAPDRVLTFETGELAPLAHGAVVVSLGRTTVLVTAVTAEPREGIDFFPLTVDVEERMYAAGKIPGSFFRREGRPTEQAILTCRLIDRPLRPSFPEGFRNEVQVVATILGADQVNPHDVVAINGASAALVVSGIPFEGPIGAVRVAHVNGAWVVHPTWQEREQATFDMVVAGRRTGSGDIAVMMVEAHGTENTWRLYEAGAPKVTEEVVVEGLEFSKQGIGASIDLQLELRARVEEARGPIEPHPYTPRFDYEPDVYEAVSAAAGERVAKALTIADKAERNATLDQVREEVVTELSGAADAPGRFVDREREVRAAFRSLQKEIVRRRIVEEGFRIDGRRPDEIRPLSAKVGVIPTAHGSALFQRGETQVLTVATLGMPRMEQMLDTIGVEDTKRYMHHYNFPPFSTGEVGRIGSPRRREIGHGALAERALLPVVPPEEEFPYAMRVVSDVLSSNGSTSMASVCGSSLSLMDAGVPIRTPVAGIAMGLVYEGGRYTTLTDILGAEDAFGDMDFKVAGTEDFVCALQLDTKIDGLPAEVLADALRQAREARLEILEVMRQAIAEPRPEVRETAPKITTLTVPRDKVGEIIGPKGKVVNTLQQETGADITIEDDGVVGRVTVGAPTRAAVDEALRRINEILNPPEPEVGKVYRGKVVNLTSFGAFVNILPGRDGLLHISKLGEPGRRVDRAEDVLELGQELTVRIDEIDARGKLALSLVEEAAVPASAGSEPQAEEEGAAGAAPSGVASGVTGESVPSSGEAPAVAAPREAPAVAAPREAPTPPPPPPPAAPPPPPPPAAPAAPDRDVVSFEQVWRAKAEEIFGDLGPERAPSRGGGRERSSRRRRRR